MKSIFVVMGQTGEYSDRMEWAVAAYQNKEDAAAHESAAKMRATELLDWEAPSGSSWADTWHTDRPTNEYDSNMQAACDCGTDYHVVEIPFFEEFKRLVLDE